MKKITRKEAIALKLTRFFTGKACKRGHVVERQVCNGCCVICAQAGVEKYQATPKGKLCKRRANTSPKGREARHRYDASPKRLMLARAHMSSQKGLENRRRAEAKRDVPARLKRRRELYLDQALDTTRDDYNPARAALLLAHAYQREGY